jgi:uncharacterized protein YcfJ
MAINTQKLLPSSTKKSSESNLILARKSVKNNLSIVPAQFFAKSEDSEKRGGALVKSERGALTKEILDMKVKVLKLQGAIDKNKKLDDKEKENKRKAEDKEKKSKREQKLEQRDTPNIKLPNLISRIPGGSILDTIKRYLGFTFLGWLVGKYEQLMPILEKFMTISKPVFEGLVFATETILKGVYGFVDAGYKAYDKVSETIKKIGGEDAEKTFNEFSSHFNKLLNGTLIAAMLIAGSTPNKKPGLKPGAIVSRTSGVPKGPKVASSTTPKTSTNLQNYLNRNQQSKLIERKYGNDAARMYDERRTQGASASRALADVRGRFEPTASQGSLAGTNQGSKIFGRGLAKAPQRAATKMFGKAAGKTVSKLGGRVPIVGPLIDFGIRTLVYKEPLGKAAAGAVGMGVGQALGGWLGGAIGGIVGSVVPFIGTMLVGAAGATVGSLIGGVIGDMVGASLYDFIAGSDKNKKKKTTGKAGGGQISSTSSPPKKPRTKVAIRSLDRKKVQPQQTQPGKDIGGRYKIEEFYGKQKISGRDVTRGEEIVKALEKTSKEVKKLPLDWVASIGGAYVDLTMGQKPDRKLASDVGKSFGNFVETVVNNEITTSTGQITKALVGMANGGSIPENNFERGQISKKVSKNIEERLQTIFDQSYAIANKNLKRESLMQQAEELREMQQRSQERRGGPSGGGGGAGGYAEGSENFVSSSEIYNYLKSKGLSHNHILGMLANIQAESSFNAGAIGDNGTSGGLFQHHAERFDGMVAFAGKDWSKNWKRQIDYALREDAGKQYANKKFKTAEEASAWFTLNFERPANKEYKASQRLENLKNFGAGGVWQGGGTQPGVSKVEALSKGFRTGLKTGPAGRIGAGTEYHVDGRFMHNIPLKDKIAMLDSMASAHAQEGFVMEFSGKGVAGSRWNPRMSMKEKEYLAKKILASHHEDRYPWQAFDYFIVKKSAKDRFDKSAEGSNIMAPILKGGTYEYQEGGGMGRFLVIRDKNGNEVMKILHGDSGVPKPKELGKVFKMNELTEAQQQLKIEKETKEKIKNLSGQQVTQVLSQKGPIPFVFKGEKFFFRVNPDKSVEAFKTKGPLGYLIQEPIDISGNKNLALRQAINEKVQSMTFTSTRKLQLKSPSSSSNDVISSTNIGGWTYTEREGGKYFQNGKPITKELFNAVKKNHPNAFKKSTRTSSLKRGIVNPSRSSRRIEKPKRAWYDPRGWFGMQGGGSISSVQQSSYSSINKTGVLKEDTSINKEMVVMYQKEIVMVPQTV